MILKEIKYNPHYDDVRGYFKPQQKHCLGTVNNNITEGVGLNRLCVATTLALSSAVVYTRHLLSPLKEFLTHQCNIS